MHIVFLIILFYLFSGSSRSTGNKSGRSRDNPRKSWANLGSNTTTGLAQKRRFIDGKEPEDLDYYEDYFDDNCD
ncbi:MAG: hypothetical protein LBG29_10050 [Synergistaceae bacterium]|nr:hypothetical protein [Synergistaceae bacterium]